MNEEAFLEWVRNLIDNGKTTRDLCRILGRGEYRVETIVNGLAEGYRHKLDKNDGVKEVKNHPPRCLCSGCDIERAMKV